MVAKFPDPLPGYPPLLDVADDISLSLEARGLYLLLWSRNVEPDDIRLLRGDWPARKWRAYADALEELIKAGHVPGPTGPAAMDPKARAARDKPRRVDEP